MPLTGDFDRLKRIAREMASMARTDGAGQKTLLRGVKQQVTLVLKEEFRTSTDPSGAHWKNTVRGQPAMQSKKLPQAFELELVDGAVKGVGKSKRDLLEALDQGHEFAARQVAANKQYLSFNRQGKLVKEGRLFNRAGQLRRGVQQVFARAHAIGKRILPPRPIIPGGGGTLPARWDAAVRAGIAVGMNWFAERLQR